MEKLKKIFSDTLFLTMLSVFIALLIYVFTVYDILTINDFFAQLAILLSYIGKAHISLIFLFITFFVLMYTAFNASQKQPKQL